MTSTATTTNWERLAALLADAIPDPITRMEIEFAILNWGVSRRLEGAKAVASAWQESIDRYLEPKVQPDDADALGETGARR